MNEASNSINKSAYLLFKQVFSNKMIQLESDTEKKDGISFSRQLDLSKLQNKIELFIEKNDHAKFELRILEKNADNLESYKYALVIKNYEHENKDKRAHMFIITVDSAFTEVTFYQLSINNVMLPL
jgi:hypothetical protein